MLNVKQFYKELGKLLYAVAATDGKIEKEEITALYDFVSKELALSESDSDSSGMNKAFYTDFEFDDYAEHHVSIQKAHDSFMRFLQANVTEMDPRLINKAIEAIEKVASSFKKVNKKEREVVDKIKTEIAEITQIIKNK